MTGITPLDERRIYYYVVWPTMFLSIHPDYLLVHWLEPGGVDATKVRCEWLFEPGTMAAPTFDPTEAVEFWDLTNRQDWHVCELQQRGTRSSSWVAGRYSTEEASVHAFDQMVADRYAGEGFISRRIVRADYKVSPPKAGETNGSNGAGEAGGGGKVARTTARAKATAPR
jgi:Rieske 2Fe-2S family protein